MQSIPNSYVCSCVHEKNAETNQVAVLFVWENWVFMERRYSSSRTDKDGKITIRKEHVGEV